MSNKHKQKKIVLEKPLAERIAKARRERRTQQALELTRQLCKHEPTETHQEILRQVTRERGQQLQAQGMLKDAVTVFNNALALGGSDEYRLSIAEHLAACGAAAQAFAMIERVSDATVRQRVATQAVDAAMAKGPAAKHELPADLQPAFDLILQAFAHSEAGNDDAARTALTGIGLQSPFLEWKVLLRGLLAYYSRDDARAIENWQRLDPQRLPGRLAAPLRFGIDPAFRQAQPVAAHPGILRQIDRVQGPTSVTGLLQSLRHDLHQENLAPAFRKAEQAVATLKIERPELVGRLAHCFAWAIRENGQPEDLDRYLRVFGAPHDDPHLHRLTALALEARGMFVEAHAAWQDFIREVAGSKTWPESINKHVQAMIWAHMGENAVLSRAKRAKSRRSFLDFLAEPEIQDVKPDAEECYQKAIELAPDRLESYRALFGLQVLQHQPAKAKKVAQDLLKHFPDHAETLEALGELHLETGDYKKAQDYFDRSLHVNPLDRSLRGKLARARQKWALELTLGGKHEQAREQYAEALKLWDGSKTSLLCQWAVAEMKAKQAARVEELLAQAQAEPDQRLACRYALVGESVRAKLPPKQKKQLTDDLKSALAQAPTPGEILVLLECAAQQREFHAESFHGQKTHEKTILKFLDQLSFDHFSERQLERLCAGLQGLDARRPWLKCLEYARRRFLKNPAFRLSWVDYYLSGANPEDKTHLAREHLDQARRLIESMPRGEPQQQLQEQIQEKEKAIIALSSNPMSMMEEIFDGFGFDDEDDDDDDDSWDDGFF